MGEDLAKLEDLACASRILEMEGHGDMTLGHLSLRDWRGRGFWLKRNAIGLGEVKGPRDFILLDFSGNRLEGDGGRHSEWPIHAEIFKCRPDVNVVAHTHPVAAALFSATEEQLRPVTIEGSYFPGGVPRHDGTGALINTPELGADLARALGDSAHAVFMRNHGVTFCGRTVPHAAMVGVFLEKACRRQLDMVATGLAWGWPDAAEAELRTSQVLTDVHIEHSWNYYRRKLEWWTANQATADGGLFGPATGL